MDEHNKHQALRDPELKPDVPSYAEKLNVLEHVRHQFHPLFKNAIGGPLIDGPKEYIGLELRCPLCKHIQPLGSPGIDHQCEKCLVTYKYTAAKGNSWLWIWRAPSKIIIDK